MRIIDGYVVACETNGRLLLSGEVLKDGVDSENLETNGLVPFSTLAEARFVAACFLNGRKVLAGETVNVGRIHLEIAEDEGDLSMLRRRRNPSFIVIYNYRGEVVNLLGMYDPENPAMSRDFDFGGRLIEKAAPFQDLEKALRLAREATRQGDAPAAVAFYRLRIFARANRHCRPTHSKR